MKAIKLAEPWQVACVELDKPTPKPGEALIRIVTAGICGSDIGAFRGTNGLVSYPRVIGHELAGIVESKRSILQFSEIFHCWLSL